MLYSGARGVLFFEVGVVITEKAAKQITIINYGFAKPGKQ